MMSTELLAEFKVSIRPPSRDSCSQWIEKHCSLPKTSAMPGNVKFDLFPCSRIFLDEVLQNPLTRRVTVCAGAQTIKTQNVIWFVMWRTGEKPTTTIWVMKSAEFCEGFIKRRLKPAFEECDAPGIPIGEWRREDVQFNNGVNIMFRGAESQSTLKSEPAGLIICDERADWKAGSIQLLRQRLKTYHDALEISLCTGGKFGDENWLDFVNGSQSFFHWYCPKCNHSQPFRFGRDISPMWPEARTCGGFISVAGCQVVDDPECKDEKGNYIKEKVIERVRYQCENPQCKELFADSDKYNLLQSIHWFHRKPHLFEKTPSLHCNQFYMLWPEYHWGILFWEFLVAMDSLSFGDVEPFKTVVTEMFGEPWEERSRMKHGEILNRCGQYLLDQYKIEYPVAEKSPYTFIMTVDRHARDLHYLIRRLDRDKPGSSMLTHLGTFANIKELRAFQVEHGMPGNCIWGDDGGAAGTVSEWRLACSRYGWQTMKAEDKSSSGGYWIQPEEKDAKPFLRGWNSTMFDPSIGTDLQGNFPKMPAWLWAKQWYNDRLYNFYIPQITGIEVDWKIPKDIPPNYVRHLSVTEYIEELTIQGRKVGKWKIHSKSDHYGCCEQMMLVIFDIMGWSSGIGNKKKE
jgi:hypothetical protein